MNENCFDIENLDVNNVLTVMGSRFQPKFQQVLLSAIISNPNAHVLLHLTNVIRDAYK